MYPVNYCFHPQYSPVFHQWGHDFRQGFWHRFWHVQGKLPASERRILITQWVGNSWTKIKTSLKDTIVQSFVKCGISNNIDGSENHLVNIRGLEDYQIPAAESEFHLISDESDGEFSYSEDGSGERRCPPPPVTQTQMTNNAKKKCILMLCFFHNALYVTLAFLLLLYFFSTRR